MSVQIVQFRASSEDASEVEAAIAGLFAAVEAAAPRDIHYLAARRDDSSEFLLILELSDGVPIRSWRSRRPVPSGVASLDGLEQGAHCRRCVSSAATPGEPGCAEVLMAVTVVCLLANSSIAEADLVPAQFVLVNSAVGLDPAVLPFLATLKGAGALGLTAGLGGISFRGLAGAVGLTLFYAGAMIVHVRAAATRSIGFPFAFLSLALGAVAHFA